MRNHRWILHQQRNDQAICRLFSKLISQGLGEVKLEQSGFGLRNALRSSSRFGVKAQGGRPVRACHLCEEYAVKQGNPCPTPEKVRPCDSIFGINVYKTVRNLGLPCEVLKTKDDVQNRYGFVLID